MELDGLTTGHPESSLNIPSAPSSSSPITTPPPPSKAPEKPFDFSKHSRRKIALKFCYSGWEYGGLSFQPGPMPLPTVENVLFDVLAKTRLIDPEGGFDGCGWEKCGRTDRGVSAAGQVVSLWVRSAIPAEEIQQEDTPRIKAGSEEELIGDEPGSDGLFGFDDGFGSLGTITESSSNTSISKPRANSELKQEHDYLVMLNRLLPDTIRVIAWSPVPETFSARFSCKYRHYKYFFPPTHLNIPKMQLAADRMVGKHDFRNLCKLDAQKQITSFRHKILRASISPLDKVDGIGRMYVFDLVGSAFLYHQVRHIMAVLFLVGSGLEPPPVVTELMNVEEGIEPLRLEDTVKYAIVDCKPEYQMANALPLMLWECGYDESELSSVRSSSSSLLHSMSMADKCVNGIL